MHSEMVVTELDSFIRKFHQLWQAGLTAHLDLDTHAGTAWVGLRVQLGHQVPGPPPQQVHPHQASSSRDRRRARRLAARKQADRVAAEQAVATPEEEAAETSEPTLETNSAEKADEKEASEEDIENVAETQVSEEEIETVAEKTKDSFECPICEFSSNSENGLGIHMGRKHRNVEQIDGCTDTDSLEIEERYDRSENYWKTGRIGIAYHIFLDANFVVDASDLPEEEKIKEKDKILEARKAAFGSSFHQFPPWKK